MKRTALAFVVAGVWVAACSGHVDHARLPGGEFLSAGRVGDDPAVRGEAAADFSLPESTHVALDEGKEGISGNFKVTGPTKFTLAPGENKEIPLALAAAARVVACAFWFGSGPLEMTLLRGEAQLLAGKVVLLPPERGQVIVDGVAPQAGPVKVRVRNAGTRPVKVHAVVAWGPNAEEGVQ